MLANGNVKTDLPIARGKVKKITAPAITGQYLIGTHGCRVGYFSNDSCCRDTDESEAMEHSLSLLSHQGS